MGRSSHEERGLKCIRITVLQSAGSRSSHEERGLKCALFAVGFNLFTSLLSRGAWIEMCAVKCRCTFFYVAPLTRSVD